MTKLHGDAAVSTVFHDKIGLYVPVHQIPPGVVARGPLAGHGALLARTEDHLTVAQFDDLSTGYGYGWHLVDPDAFEPKKNYADAE